jgi:hypothetical protein
MPSRISASSAGTAATSLPIAVGTWVRVIAGADAAAARICGSSLGPVGGEMAMAAAAGRTPERPRLLGFFRLRDLGMLTTVRSDTDNAVTPRCGGAQAG